MYSKLKKGCTNWCSPSCYEKLGALERTRTFDPQLRKLMLYPLSYERARK